ncbi:MAG: hypothetical protein K8R31_04045 [Bacteroidales bacterium]|nr:hypothetical protein [Bacteroidales bacterium]
MNVIKKIIIENKYLYWLQIFSNWFFQGNLKSGKTERIYKISFTFFFWIIGFLIFLFNTDMLLIYSIVISFIIGHTLNWLLNCNLHVLLIHNLKWLKISKEKLFEHLHSIEKRLDNKNWILYCIVLGSICKGKLNGNSDIDVSVIRKPGVKNAISAMICYMVERKHADFKGIPLDFFICDTPEDAIFRSKGQKNPIVLYDPENIVGKYYNEKLNINEAQKLNETPSDLKSN